MGGKAQKMTFANGVAKGLKVVLEERGVDMSGMNGDEMRVVFKSHPDFKYEKSKIERYLTEECLGITLCLCPHSLNRVQLTIKCLH